jgi:hypothetical protein
MDQRYELKFWDRDRVPWIIKFYVDSFAGSIETLKGSKNPLTIDYQNGSDDIFDPWKPSQISIEITVTSNFKFTDLFAPHIMSCFVEVYQNTDADEDLYWNGWVDPSQYEEPYDVAPYYMKITCVDGLSYLSDIAFAELENSDGTFEFYYNRVSESQIILDILGKIGYTEFIEYINYYEDSMAVGVSSSPFTQLLIERERFEGMACDEVIKELLIKYNAAIRQRNGLFCIYRPTDTDKSIVYGRYFQGASATSSITMSPIQYINRTLTHQTALQQVPGGTTMQQLPAKRIVIKQEYGSKTSWIENYALHRDMYDDYLHTFDQWTTAYHYGSTTPPIPMSQIVSGEDEGVMLYQGTSIHQTFAEYALLGGTDKFKIELEYGFYSTGVDVENDVFSVFSLRLGNTYTIRPKSDDATDLQWVNTSPYVDTATVPPGGVIPARHDSIGYGWSGWFQYSGTFMGFDVAAPLQIWLQSVAGTKIRVCWRSIKFYCSSTKLSKITYKRSFMQRVTGTALGYEQGRTTWFGKVLGLGPKYVIKKKREEDEFVIENEYVPVSNVDHGQVLEYNYKLGDIVRVSDPSNDGDTDIYNNLEQFTGSFAISRILTLAETTMKFMVDNHSSFYAVGVFITYSTSGGIVYLHFRATVYGGNFTTGAAISGEAGITGTASTVATAIAGARMKVEYTISGTYGEYGSLTINGVTRLMYWYGSSITSTIHHFVRKYEWSFQPVDIEYTTEKLIIYGDAEGTAFTYSWSNAGGLDASASETAGATQSTRWDMIQLAGTSGYATISCNGVSKTIAFTMGTAVASSQWGTGDASSDSWPHKPLLQLMGDEIAGQYSRVKQLIQMPIIERIPNQASDLNMLGCFIDTENEYGGFYRVFVANRGTFDVRNRKWEIDMMELIPYEGPTPEIIHSSADEVEMPESSEDPYYPPSEDVSGDSTESGVDINHIDTIADGVAGNAMTASFEYTATSAKTVDIVWYLSQDAAGHLMIGSEHLDELSATSGTHTHYLSGAYYVADAHYLHVQVLGDVDYVHSNQFDCTVITITSIVDSYGTQLAGDDLDPVLRFAATVADGGASATIYWRLKYGSTILTSGSKSFTFSASGNYSFDAITVPSGDYNDCRLEVGPSFRLASAYSNYFNIMNI